MNAILEHAHDNGSISQRVGGREEVRQIFAANGFKDDDLDRVVEVITSNEQRWIDTMLVGEPGIAFKSPLAFKAVMTTFLALCLVGILPLLAFVSGIALPVNSASLFALSTVMTVAAFYFSRFNQFIFRRARMVGVGQDWKHALRVTLQPCSRTSSARR